MKKIIIDMGKDLINNWWIAMLTMGVMMLDVFLGFVRTGQVEVLRQMSDIYRQLPVCWIYIGGIVPPILMIFAAIAYGIVMKFFQKEES